MNLQKIGLARHESSIAQTGQLVRASEHSILPGSFPTFLITRVRHGPAGSKGSGGGGHLLTPLRRAHKKCLKAW